MSVASITCPVPNIPYIRSTSNAILPPPPPPPADSTMDSDPTMEPELDPEISSIRAEIRSLQSRKRFLSSSLLASDSLQKHLSSAIPAQLQSQSQSQSQTFEEASPLLQTATSHAESNHHRIAFSTTTFPFKDPSPQNDSSNKLLGVRIDICARNGRFAKPYYVLLKRDSGTEGKQGKQQRRLRVHRHTIPAFISMQRLERLYLPVPASGAGRTGHEEEEDDEELNLKPWKRKQKKSNNNRKQDLHAFVRALRRELVAWQLRRDAIGFLREKLGVNHHETDANDTASPFNQNIFSEEQGDGWLPINSMGLVSLAPTALEARYVRFEWEDGRAGRFKMSNTGLVERAVVIGDRGRDKVIESAMTGGDGRVEGVLDRLMEYTASQTT